MLLNGSRICANLVGFGDSSRHDRLNVRSREPRAGVRRHQPAIRHTGAREQRVVRRVNRIVRAIVGVARAKLAAESQQVIEPLQAARAEKVQRDAGQVDASERLREPRQGRRTVDRAAHRKAGLRAAPGRHERHVLTNLRVVGLFVVNQQRSVER